MEIKQYSYYVILPLELLYKFDWPPVISFCDYIRFNTDNSARCCQNEFKGAFVLCHVAFGKPYIFEDSVHDFYWFPSAKSWNQDSIIGKGINTLGNQTEVVDAVNDFNGIEILEINLPNPTKTNDHLLFDTERTDIKAIVKLPMECICNKSFEYKCL